MRIKKTASLVAVLCALVLVAVPLPASAGKPGSDNVDLRANPFGAAYNWGQETTSVDTSSNSMPKGWDKRVSSLWVWSPVDTISLYKALDRKGEYLSFTYGTDDLRWYDWNDLTRSYKGSTLSEQLPTELNKCIIES